VKEGDKVKKGDRLLLQENIQAGADVQAQSASINSAEAGVEAAEASYQGAQAISCCNRLTWRRPSWTGNEAKVCSRTGLIPKQDFDQRKTGYDAAAAQVDSSQGARAFSQSHARSVRSQSYAGPLRAGAHPRYFSQTDLYVSY